MKKIFVINGGQSFGESKGQLNKTITEWTETFLKDNDFEIKVTNVSDGFDGQEEVEKFLWADLIIWHTPIWWFQLPYTLKEYIDSVFEHGRGILFKNDGRTRTNPEVNYGTGGLLQGRKYIITTTWNAPKGAFTLENEVMNETSVDAGPLFGFHIAMKFIGLEKLEGFHFYDVVKGMTPEKFEAYKNNYQAHLSETLS